MPRPPGATAVWSLGLLALVAVVVGLSVPEDGRSAWSSVHAWGAVAIVGALLVLAPVAAVAQLGAARAWQVAVTGAAALVLYWVLFVLPAVGSNTSLVTTVGVGAGVLAAWLAPGREAAGEQRRPDRW